MSASALASRLRPAPSRLRALAPRSRHLRRLAEAGPRSRIASPVLGIVNPASIALGAGVDIRAHAFLEALAPPGHVVLRIGDGTYIGHAVRITALGGVTIGRRVLISDRVYISDTGHVYEDPSVPVMDQPLRAGRRVLIEDGAWLGIGCVVVGNVRIGRGAVVAANAVVREDVPDHTVVAGDPARPVRRLVAGNWERCEAG